MKMRNDPMDCNHARAALHAYLDGELDAPGALEIDRHVAACEPCRALLKRQSLLRAGVRSHARYHTAPEALAARIRAQLEPSDRQPNLLRGPTSKAAVSNDAASTASNDAPPNDRRSDRAPSRRRHFRRPASAARRWLELGGVAAAAAAVSWVAALQLTGPSAAEMLAEQVIAGHARAVLTSHLVDVETSDQHTVKPWLSSKLDFSPPVTDLSGAGFPLVGGRLDYLDHRPVATLVYHARQHVIDLFVWPDQESSAPSASSGSSDLADSSNSSNSAPRPARWDMLSKHGYNVLHWHDAGMEYWAISDLNAAELETFAGKYSAAK
jgi:anti-sigma factor (TIGR02949 family)